MDENIDIKSVIASNIAFYRKAKGLTQSDLAKMLSYSDKAVSKWERAESAPDIFVLKHLAVIFEVSLDELTEQNDSAAKSPSEPSVVQRGKLSSLLNSHKLIIPILSAGIVWLVATILFVFLEMFTSIQNLHLCFLYAIPISLIVLIVFSAIWGNKILSAIIVSLLIWTVPLAVFLTFNKLQQSWQLFLISIPLQVLVVLWYIMRIKAEKVQKQRQDTYKEQKQKLQGSQKEKNQP